MLGYLFRILWAKPSEGGQPSQTHLMAKSDKLPSHHKNLRCLVQLSVHNLGCISAQPDLQRAPVARIIINQLAVQRTARQVSQIAQMQQRACL